MSARKQRCTRSGMRMLRPFVLELLTDLLSCLFLPSRSSPTPNFDSLPSCSLAAAGRTGNNLLYFGRKSDFRCLLRCVLFLSGIVILRLVLAMQEASGLDLARCLFLLVLTAWQLQKNRQETSISRAIFSALARCSAVIFVRSSFVVYVSSWKSEVTPNFCIA